MKRRLSSPGQDSGLDHQDDFYKWKALCSRSRRIAGLFVQEYAHSSKITTAFRTRSTPEPARSELVPPGPRAESIFSPLTVTGLTSVVAHDAQLTSGSRRYSAGSFRPSRSITPLNEQTIPPVPNVCIRARRPLVRVKSRHACSDVIDTNTNDDTSLHSFTFPPFILFPDYRRLDSYLDVAPQDRCSCQTRTSASLDSHRTSVRLIDRVVEHPIHGWEAH